MNMVEIETFELLSLLVVGRRKRRIFTMVFKINECSTMLGTEIGGHDSEFGQDGYCIN